jgi:hypothetical protein
MTAVLALGPTNADALSEQELERVAGGASIKAINSVVEVILPVFRSLVAGVATVVIATPEARFRQALA